MEAKEILKKIADVIGVNFTKETTETEIMKLGKVLEVNKWEITVDNEDFKIGDKITVSYEGSDPFNLSDGEYELEDGRVIQVDSDGIIVLITNTDGTVETITKEEAKDDETKEAKEDEAKEDEVELSEEEKKAKEVELAEEVATKLAADELQEEASKVEELETRIVALEAAAVTLTEENTTIKEENSVLKEEPATKPVTLKAEAKKTSTFSEQMISQMANARKEKGLKY